MFWRNLNNNLFQLKLLGKYFWTNEL